MKLGQQNARDLPDNWTCGVSVLRPGWEKTAGELGPGYFLGGLCPVLHPDRRRREYCVQHAGQQRGGRPPSVQQQRGHPVAPAGGDVLLRLQQTQVTTPWRPPSGLQERKDYTVVGGFQNVINFCKNRQNHKYLVWMIALYINISFHSSSWTESICIHIWIFKEFEKKMWLEEKCDNWPSHSPHQENCDIGLLQAFLDFFNTHTKYIHILDIIVNYLFSKVFLWLHPGLGLHSTWINLWRLDFLKFFTGPSLFLFWWMGNIYILKSLR